MEVTPLFFLECVYLILFYPSFAFDIWYVVCARARVCVCVCVCGVISGLTYSNFFLYVCECVSLDFLCVHGSVVWNRY